MDTNEHVGDLAPGASAPLRYTDVTYLFDDVLLAEDDIPADNETCVQTGTFSDMAPPIETAPCTDLESTISVRNARNARIHSLQPTQPMLQKASDPEPVEVRDVPCRQQDAQVQDTPLRRRRKG